MAFALKDLENAVTDKVYLRGLKYLREGRVSNVHLSDKDTWVADVEGSDSIYEVEIKIKNEQVISCSCGCPYDFVCKHLVAAILSIEKLRGSGSKTAAEKPKADTKGATKKLIGNEALYAKYLELEPQFQRLIKVGALCWAEMEASKITAVYCLRYPKQRNSAEVSNIKDHLADLVAYGFFTIPRRDKIQIDQSFAHYLCEEIKEIDLDFQALIPHVERSLQRRYSWDPLPPEEQFRNIRFAYLQDDIDTFRSIFDRGGADLEAKILNTFLPAQPDSDKLKKMPPRIFSILFITKLINTFQQLKPVDWYYAYGVEHIASFHEDLRDFVANRLIDLALVRGEFEVAEKLAPHATVSYQIFVLAWLNWLVANDDLAVEQAIAMYNNGLKLMGKEIGHNILTWRRLNHLLFVPVALKLDKAESKKMANAHLKSAIGFNSFTPLGYNAQMGLMHFLNSNKSDSVSILNHLNANHLHEFFWCLLCRYWTGHKALAAADAIKLMETLTNNGYQWMAYEMATLLHQLDPEQLKWQEFRARFISGSRISGKTISQIETLTEAVPIIKPWENTLRMLLELTSSGATVDTLKGSRIIWLIDFESLSLEAKLQIIAKKGGWTSGRSLNWYQLSSKEAQEAMSDQDKLFYNAVDSNSYYSPKPASLEKGLPYLAGHPLLFLSKSPGVKIELNEVKPTLVATEAKSGYQLSFSPKVNPDLTCQVIKETPTRYQLVRITPEITKIARALDGEQVTVPIEGKEKLQKVLGGLVKFTQVQSALDPEDANIKTVESDARPCVHMLPAGDGMHVEILVRPFPDFPPYFKPGVGESIVFTDIRNEKVKTARDLKAEKSNHKALLQKLPSLHDLKPKNGSYIFEDAGESLEFLLDLQPLMAEKSIVVEWPKGEKYRIVGEVGFDQFRMDMGSKQDWFSVNGSMQINENTVLNMRKLLEWLEKQRNGFFEVSPGHFVKLKKDFLQKLKLMSGVLMPQRDGSFQVHPLALPVMEGFTEALVDSELPRQYHESLDRLKKAFNTNFSLPKDFEAKLRPYQQEGFEWLCRCEMWGVGACLADDMGLGKTVQALAFVLARADQGPTLVVAPASVCRNWNVEIKKFTPTLTPLLFGEGDRAEMIEQAGPRDILIVTYDLMARSGELFTKKEFNIIILDEAQAIKNRMTKRSEVAMQLQGRFKLIMSGTPLENHLGELWNLFQFANPGLLGTIEFFNERFASPIERYGDEMRSEQLRNLVAPFILRRRKDEVLKELPAKTEIVLNVELPEKERAFYEALRRSVVDMLEAKMMEQGNEGTKQLQILAELMRLRRAACHPNLVDENSGFEESAKMRLFSETIDELLENGHKALIFSQFVGHLTLLEGVLKQKGIKYQYLDGQTPLAKRQQRIEAFQRGEGEFFLISLKAGGVGLNLTAADYVLHMDPWWNPAVEDQATDRAHRIGQEKPVTVYRFVAEGTIEEKILQLHEQKRDLADSLLAGADKGVRLSADEMLELIRNK